MDTKTIALILGVGITAAAASALVTNRISNHEFNHDDAKPSVVSQSEEKKQTLDQPKQNIEQSERRASSEEPPAAPVQHKSDHEHSVASQEKKMKTVTERVCEQKPVTEEVQVTDAPPPPQHNPAGILIGGLLGGVVGNQVGDGNGRTLATIAGAGAGAYVGDKIAQKNQEQKSGTHSETKTVMKEVCHDETRRVPVN